MFAAFALLLPTPAPAADLAAATCAAIAARVEAIPGDGPVFLASYDEVRDPALRGAAFTYDNALATIALVGCGRPAQAARIGRALSQAALLDRSGQPGRLRNAYRAGAQTERPIPPMGWWDAAAGRWVEDAYQVGSATGNLAWAALALLALDAPRFHAAAAEIAAWVVRHTRDEAGGFTGGLHGFDDRRLGWKSTEHVADLAAVFGRLGMDEQAAHARRFLDAMWAAGDGHFPTGTLPDGVTVNRATSGLDAQLWPLLLADAPAAWRAALDHAERAHGVPGGFDFNDDRDGLWLEGTAQAALVYRHLGRAAEAARLLAGIAGHVAPGGYVYATREPRLTTGLAIGPDSVGDDFHYYRTPHLGATAWAALAATGFNPFTGGRISLSPGGRGPG